jgi:hypothetical protein
VNRGWLGFALILAAVVLAGLGSYAEIVRTRPLRQGVATLYKLVAAGNREDLEAARRHCTARVLRESPPRIEGGGGVTGLPRSIDPNFKAWRHGPEVWVCPTDRVGPVYRMVEEGGAWKFDGLVGYRQADGEVVPRLEPGGVEGRGSD